MLMLPSFTSRRIKKEGETESDIENCVLFAIKKLFIINQLS